MQTLLKLLGKLDTAQNILSAMLDMMVKISISPCMDESFFVILTNDDETSDECEESIMSIIIHTQDGEAVSWHTSSYNGSDKYDYNKLGKALASALDVFEEYKR